MQVTPNEFEILHSIATHEDQEGTGEDIINFEIWIAFSRQQRHHLKTCINKGYVMCRDMYNAHAVHITPEGYKAYENAIIDLAKLAS